eukprot:TRINITY_DN830_c0_g1_i1.p1 TRINITY_DN830_c0_g1~~TRINITY_DN830_c0_g1_i1.p1  ORF type:complete len:1131 (+),score=360.09 TRINITY_DN830_c0_g1_i1:101-3493(+)
MEEALAQIFEQSSARLPISDIQPLLQDHQDKINAEFDRLFDGKVSKENGRLGPRKVELNPIGAVGPFVLSESKLEIESAGNFSSIRGSACVFEGKWSYETTLLSSGIQQIGWAPLAATFTTEEGVGDAPDSYAYDGKRLKKWNGSCRTYGHPWVAGDVISSCIDLTNGTIHFFRNGKAMGEAFNTVRHGEDAIGLAYFPALSLSYSEKSILNFGGTPFAYPIPGYEPLQSPPTSQSFASYLCQCLVRLMRSSLSKDDVAFIGGIIFDRLGPLLCDDYNVIASFFPALRDLLELDADIFTHFLSQLEIWLEDFEWQHLWETIFKHLGHILTITGPANNQGTPLPFVIKLIQVESILKVLSNLATNPNVQTSRDKIFENFFAAKQPSSQDLISLFPQIWFPNAGETLPKKFDGVPTETGDIFDDIAPDEETVEKRTKELGWKELQDEEIRSRDQLIRIFLPPVKKSHDTDSMETDEVPIHRIEWFMGWLTRLVHRNKGANRNIPPPGLSDGNILANIYFALTRYLLPFFQSGNTSIFPVESLFFENPNSVDFSRLGGLYGHLKKTLGIPKDVTAPPPVPLEIALFDNVLLLYHLAVSSQFKALSVQIQHQTQNLLQLEETNARIAKLLLETGTSMSKEDFTKALDPLRLAKKVFLRDVVEYVRAISWQHTQLTRPENLLGMWSSILYGIHLFEDLEKNPKYPILQVEVQVEDQDENVKNMTPIAWIVEYWLDAFIDGFHALRRCEFSFTAGLNKELVGKEVDVSTVLGWLMSHIGSESIVSPDIREVILESLGWILHTSPQWVRRLESKPLSDFAPDFIRLLLKKFDSRNWVSIANIFLGFWKGSSFSPWAKPSENPSPFYQRVFGQVCAADPQLTNEFVNRIFNHLNWAVTEFGVSSKELLTSMNKMHPNELNQTQRKCNIMFDLSVSLARLLEFITKEVPMAFIEQSMNMLRLTELIAFILNRVTVGPDAKNFENLLALESPHLQKITRGSILGPIVGMITNLKKSESGITLEKAFIATGGFSPETTRFLCAIDWNKGALNLNGLEERQTILKEFEISLEKEIEANKERETSLKSLPSAEFCSICYAAAIDTEFVPCGHTSCHTCIERHLLNSNKCFYCNATIEKIEKIN